MLILLLLPLGCRNYADNTPRPAPQTARYPQAVADPLPTGRVYGRVVWAGEGPVVPPVDGLIDTGVGAVWGTVANPFAPRIDPDGGVADVVVSLSPVDPERVKPWPYAPLAVERAGRTLRAEQGGSSGRVGFVRVGDEVELAIRTAWPPFAALAGGLGHTPEGKFYPLRARGAAYFTFTFPEPDQPRKRTLDTPGVVEFGGAAGDFWNAVDVVVCEHPYYAATDAAGRFDLKHVPPGEYDVTVRVRNWHLTGRDRDPETGKIVRLNFADPVRLTRGVRVPSDEPVRFEVNAGHFSQPGK